MQTMFTRAAIFAVALMVSTAGLGLWLPSLHDTTDPAVLRWGTVHRLSGMFAALVVLLVNSMSVTYFIGTGRWCREVVEAYGLSGEFIERSRQLKRKAFPFAVVGMLAVVSIVGLGGAADPGGGLAGPGGSRDWVTWHLVGGIGLACLIAWCFQGQVPMIRRQHELIEEVMGEVRRERAARGLDT